MQQLAEQVAPSCSETMKRLTCAADTNGAFAHWSEVAENALLAASRDVDGEVLRAASFRGRGQHTKPVSTRLAAPRYKQGRSGDFTVSCPSVALRVRRLQKQVRRLHDLKNSLKLVPRIGVNYPEIRRRLWNAILTSPAFTPSFVAWAVQEGFSIGFCVPDLDTLDGICEKVEALAKTEAQAAWRVKKVNFQQAVEDSWKREGGAPASRLLRDPQKPSVSHLVVDTLVQLSPQPWSPYGKATFGVKNALEFAPAHTLLSGNREVQVTSVTPTHISVDRRLTRREAAHLFKSVVSADPEVWAPFFLKQWEQFWQRDQDEEHGDFHEIVDVVPTIAHQSLVPITFQEWQEALVSAKTSTMRGVDSWSPKELKRLPETLVRPLLDLFSAIEQGAKWPTQLTTWLVILLRKNSDPVPAWGGIRPISVAGLVYRIWSRIRVRHFLKHVEGFAPPLVKSRLSTKAIWCMLADYFDRATQQRRPLCGVVLDIIKAFNVLNRELLLRLFAKLGFDHNVSSAWVRALGDLRRCVLVAGMSYGSSAASTGIPEGDPMSIVGMYLISYAFACFVQHHGDPELVLTYADNWELVTPTPEGLVRVLGQIERFVQIAKLPLAPDKCWVWSLSKSGRKVLRRQARLCEVMLPLQLQARDLGADIAYCLRRAAKVRNSRIQTGHKKLCRLRGIPGSRYHKVRLLVSSVWPHTLHAAETSLVPKTTFTRLRTLAARALDLAPKGSSPWLSCSVPGQKCIDPEFRLLLSRVRLFRQVMRELPGWHTLFCGRLVARAGRYHGPTRLLALVLKKQGWRQYGPLCFLDEDGRSFNLMLSSEAHIEWLLVSKWMDRVVREVCHRKYLRELRSISLPITRTEHWLIHAQRPLVQQQWIGTIFSQDQAKHFCESRGVCPLCKGNGNRLHRLMYCPGTLDLRQRSQGITRLMADLPISTVAYGLWEEHPSLRAWHGSLDALSFPQVPRVASNDPRILYSDGTCLHPRYKDIRLAAGAVIEAHGCADWNLVWTGVLPTADQSAFRAELLAGIIAVQSSTVLWLFSDCWAFVKVARRFLAAKRTGTEPRWPTANLDLWIRFWEALNGLDYAKV